jgi:hypothetical protein
LVVTAPRCAPVLVAKLLFLTNHATGPRWSIAIAAVARSIASGP